MDSATGVRLDPRRHRKVRNYFLRVFLHVLWWDVILNRRAVLAGGELSALLVLQGCMIDRVYTMRAQMCGTEDSIRISEADGMHVSFLKPVIHAGDVKWLSGVQPHSETYTPDELTMRYIVTKTGAPEAENFAVPVELAFRKIDGEYKLAQMDVTTDLPFDLSPERMNRMTASACENDLNPFTRKVAMTLAREDLEELPKRDEVFSLVGTPNWANDDDTKLRYEFSIAGTVDDTGVIVVDLEYDASGTQLLSMTSSYSHFTFNADFQSGEVSTSFST